MKYIGIVGHESAKFTPQTEAKAKQIIRDIILSYSEPVTVVSGHCHLGGIDIWAEEIADELGMKKLIFPPKQLNWEKGYKPRNIQIAMSSQVVHCINVSVLPDTYKGIRFTQCYHCETKEHIKSGGCWTAKYAKDHGREAIWHVVK